MEHPGYHWTDFSCNLLFEYSSKNVLRRLKLHENLAGITGPLHEDVRTCMPLPRWILLRMRNVSDRIWRESQNTHLYFHLFYLENRTVCEINLKKYIIEPDRSQITIWCMRIACWITKATNTHSEYAILNAFSLQQWLHERASVWRNSPLPSLIKM